MGTIPDIEPHPGAGPSLIRFDVVGVPRDTADAGAWTIGANASQYAGFYLLQNTAVQNDSVTWNISIPSGLWTVNAFGVTTSNLGIATISFDGVTATTIDFYTLTTIFNANIAGAGSFRLPPSRGVSRAMKLQMATKNALSSGFSPSLSSLIFKRSAF